VQSPFPQRPDSDAESFADAGLQQVIARFSTTLNRDQLVKQVTHDLQQHLQVDRVVLYYFYR
jgi:GAF domain-containing protein